MKHRTATLAVLSITLLASVVFVSPRLAETGASASAAPAPEPLQRRRRQTTRRPAAQRRPRVDYSKFNHRTRQHQQACSTCHTIPTDNWNSKRVLDVRKEPFPDVTDYPDHPSCVNCHRNEFFRGARPVICTICHTNVSPRDDKRYPFQNPEEGFVLAPALKKQRTGGTQFTIRFPHDKHQDVMARTAPPSREDPAAGVGFVRASFAPRRQQPTKPVDNCSICHTIHQPAGKSTEVFAQPTPSPFPESNKLRIAPFFLKKGTFMTTPTSHAACFNCHYQDGGEKPLANDCAGCHTLLKPSATPVPSPTPSDMPDAKTAEAMGVTDRHIVAKWLRREAATFRHEHSKHVNVGCTACHVNITGISTLDQKTFEVPITTCATSECHGKPTAPTGNLFKEVQERRKPDGKDYACIKCHLSYGKAAVPPSHEALYPARK